jgi:pseudouridine-5'-phosphate glycosidase
MLPISFHPDVQNALKNHQPVVALESTIITHGMPWPQNVAVARDVEQVVRNGGCIPATIAVFDGAIHIGLSDEQLETLAQSKDVMKLSRADLAFALSTGRTGATTVAATMIAANLAGIAVFATGGIGGVHKGAEKSFDISADLSELAHTSVIVVSAGPKAILDGEKTMEVLETQGVPVVTYGADTLPAFWSRQSDIPSPLRLDSASEIAQFSLMRQRLKLAGGVLIANPVPEADEIPAKVMAKHIARATSEADENGISGKEVTPWLLGRMLELTDGESLITNIALVKNNARLAAEIAVELIDTQVPS